MSGGGARSVIELGLHRVRQRASGGLLAALGVAAAAAFLAAVIVGAGVAQDRSVARSLEDLPAAARSVRAVWFGIPAHGEDWGELDTVARRSLASLDLGTPIPVVLVRESTVAGRFVGLAGVEGLARHVLVRSGRLPRSCVPARCEVLRLRGRGPLPNAPGLRLVQVGTASLRSRLLFGDFLPPTDNALLDATLAPAFARSARYHRPAPAPLVVAEGVRTLAAAPPLARTYRSYAWVLPLAPGRPRVWVVDGLVGHADQARAELRAAASGWELAAPAEELTAARDEAVVAGRRLVLVGGQAAALLLAFAILVAGAFRTDVAAARRRLVWNGASRGQLRLLAATESLAVGFVGVAAGWIVGAMAGIVLARVSGTPAGPLLRETVLAPGGLVLAAGTALAIAGVLWAVVSTDAERGRGRVLDAVAIAAIAFAVALLLGGRVDVDRLLASRSAAATLLLLPGLIGLAAAIVAARLLPSVGRAVGRAGNGRPAAVLAGAGLERGATSFAAAFLTLAVALAFFAAGYHGMLTGGQRDQAAFRVPTDVRVSENLATLVPVFDVATGKHVDELVPPEHAHSVLRASASAGSAQRIGGVTILGLPEGAFGALPIWRTGWGPTPSSIADEVKPRGTPALRGLRLAGRRELALDLGPTQLALRAVIVDRTGIARSLTIGPGRPDRSTRVAAPVPPPLRGGLLVALDLVPPPRLIERGANAGLGYRGTVDLRLPGADLGGWLGENGVAVVPIEGGVRLDYTLTLQRTARVRAKQLSDVELPAVVATPRLVQLAGGVGRTLPLQIAGDRVLFRVVGQVERFPGAGEDAVVGDVGALAAALDTSVPGAGRLNELWLEVPAGAEQRVLARLALPPFRPLAVESRRALEHDLQSDPLARGTLLALFVASGLALGLGVLGLALVVRAALRDEAGELLDLEAQGVEPRFLIRLIRGRALVVGLLGLTAGAVTGTVLLGLVGRIVIVTSGAKAPEPPLVMVLDPLRLGGALALAVAVAVVVVAAATRSGLSAERQGGLG